MEKTIIKPSSMSCTVPKRAINMILIYPYVQYNWDYAPFMVGSDISLPPYVPFLSAKLNGGIVFNVALVS